MDNKTEWQTEAYRYVSGVGDAIHVECIVRICLDTDQSAECSHCSSRKRRAADDGDVTGETALIQSPIFYIADKGTFTFNHFICLLLFLL